MKLEKIQQLFENVSQQGKEEIILGNIIRCKEIINQNPYTNKHNGTTKDFIQLFESIAELKISSTDMFLENENILDIKDFRNNIYAYLSNVKKLLESTKDGLSILFENEMINDFHLSIQDLLKNLDKVNDINKYEILNESILKTKLFAKQPIIINGVNLFEVEKIKDSLNIRELYGIIYNKSEKHLVFIGDGNMIYYDIKTDKLDDVRSLDYVDNFKFNKSNFLEQFKLNVSNNIIIIYKNISELKFVDNLYNDVARITEINRINALKQQTKSQLNFFK